MAEHDHEVAVYDTTADLARRVAGYVADGLAADERCISLARPAVRLAIDDELSVLGVDAIAAERHGLYLPMDAAEALGRFLVDGVPDAARFLRLAAETMPDGTRVRAYGEMVSLLWERGDVVAALQLETLWSAYTRGRPITVLCSYPSAAVAEGPLGDVSRLCELHTSVDVAGDYALPVTSAPSPSDAQTGVLMPVPAAVGVARHFAVDVVSGWERRDLAADAALVVSELATNAVTHGGSPFRASMHREGETVRVAVEDVAATWPERHDALPSDLDGRGIAIVEALASRTGCSVSAEGKVAWADLAG